MVAFLAPLLPAIGGALGSITAKGVAMFAAKTAASGAASYGASKLIGKGAENTQDQEQGQNQDAPPSAPGEPAPQGQQQQSPYLQPPGYGAPQGVPYGVPYLSPPGQYMPMGYGMAAPAVMGPPMMMQQGQVAPSVSAYEPATTATPAEPENPYGDQDGRAKSMLETVGAALAGGVGGMALAKKDGAEGFEALSKGLLGAGAGAFAKMSHDGISEEGGGVKAGVAGAVAAGLASRLKEGGPGMLSSAAFGFGGGATANKLHDHLTETSSKALADAVSGGLQGGSLGYAITGDLKQSGLIAGGSAGLSTVLGNGLGELVTDSKKALGMGDEESAPTKAAPEAGPQMV